MGIRNDFVFGVGINDADYVVQPCINGRQDMCLFYRRWRDMLDRCYSEKVKFRQPTYADCTVCDEWLTFSNFKSWMEKQDWHGKQLDKDILVKGNKVYSPGNCAFIDSVTNKFITDSAATRGEFMVGVCFKKKAGKLVSQCNNPFTGERECLGYFTDEMSAHLEWKKRKHELACQLADLQTDERVANALRKRYAD